MRVEGTATAAAGPGQFPEKPSKLREAAEGFEALLLAQMLRHLREAGSAGSLGSGEEDQAGATMLEVAEEHLARTLAAQGGLGLANLVVDGLSRSATGKPDPKIAKQPPVAVR